ncbi:MAG: HAD family hydrolase [Firmicutes bacterium]|nr:HAD family hydrolase [Bacillota bacterium]
MLKTVLFDLDDTLFDHKYARLCALRALQDLHPVLQSVPLDELEKEHEILLAAGYFSVLDKTISLYDSRLERIRSLFRIYGVSLSGAETKYYAGYYNHVYEKNRQAVPGAKRFLESLKPPLIIGVVSNGLTEFQMEKIRLCEMEGLIDFTVFSEDVGVRKPNRRIFEIALEKAAASPEEALFIGDAWPTDIVGANNCGIRSIWLNRYGLTCPDPKLAHEIHDFDSLENIITPLFRHQI